MANHKITQEVKQGIKPIQRNILIIGGLIIILMALVPPYRIKYTTSLERYLGSLRLSLDGSSILPSTKIVYSPIFLPEPTRVYYGSSREINKGSFVFSGE